MNRTTRKADPGRALERALHVTATAAETGFRVVDAVWTEWASATFAGARHRLVLELPANDAAAAWLDGLSESDLPIPHQFVADLVQVAGHRREDRLEVVIEVLTLDRD